MRFESPGLLGFFKVLAPLVGLWLLYRFLQFDFDDFVYQLSKVDWLYVILGIAFFLILFGVPLYRLFKEYRIWKVLCTPFRIVKDPFIDVDLKEESYGQLFLENGHMIKQVAVFASKDGVIVRKAAYPKLFPTFEITWDEITNIYFASLTKDSRFGSDPFGAARVTLGFAEEFILVLPWRELFNTFIPDRIGLKNEKLVG